jgi:hypothetical protein
LSSVRVKPRSFWQWLTGQPRMLVTMSWRGDVSGIFDGEREPAVCAWCDLGNLHTTEAHRIQKVKRELLLAQLRGDTNAGRKLDALIAAEREYR